MSRLDLPEMRKMLERAIELDPHFAQGRAEYGFTHALMFIGGQSNDSGWLYKAEEEIRRALKDDPHNGRAHSALAGVYLVGGRKELVPAEVEKALQDNARDAAAYGFLQNYHQLNGDTIAPARSRARSWRSTRCFFPCACCTEKRFSPWATSPPPSARWKRSRSRPPRISWASFTWHAATSSVATCKRETDSRADRAGEPAELPHATHVGATVGPRRPTRGRAAGDG